MKLQKSFLHNKLINGKFGEAILLTLLNSSTICLTKGKSMDVTEKDEVLIDLKVTYMLRKDRSQKPW